MGLVPFKMNAQPIKDGFYTNENGFICIKSDSISFCLANHSAFDTYQAILGTYIFRNNKLRIKAASLENLNSNLEFTKSNDSLSNIKLIQIDGEPLEFTSVRITWLDNGKLKTYINYSDRFGNVVINHNLYKNWLNKKITILIQSIGFETRQSLSFEKSTNYLIKLRMNINTSSKGIYTNKKIKAFKDTLIIQMKNQKPLLFNWIRNCNSCKIELFKYCNQ